MRVLGRIAGIAAIAFGTTALAGCVAPPPPPPPVAAVTPDEALPAPPPAVGMAAPYQTPAYPAGPTATLAPNQTDVFRVRGGGTLPGPRVSGLGLPAGRKRGADPVAAVRLQLCAAAIWVYGPGCRGAEQRRDDSRRRSLRAAAATRRDPAASLLATGDVATGALGLERDAVLLGTRALRRTPVANRQLGARQLAAGAGRLDVDQRLLELTQALADGVQP